MNGQNEQQLPLDLSFLYRNMFAERRDGRGHRDQAGGAMQAFSFLGHSALFRTLACWNVVVRLCGLAVVHSTCSAF